MTLKQWVIISRVVWLSGMYLGMSPETNKNRFGAYCDSHAGDKQGIIGLAWI